MDIIEHLQILEAKISEELEELVEKRDEAGRTYRSLTTGAAAEQEFGRYSAYMDGVTAISTILERVKTIKKCM